LFCDENERELHKLAAGGSRRILLADPTRTFNVPFTITRATILTEAGHAAKTSGHRSKLLQSVSYDVEHARNGVVIDENVKQLKAATTLRSPASSSRRAPSPRCRASARGAIATHRE
jgi:ATP-dependent protease Clp ATPase subunit